MSRTNIAFTCGASTMEPPQPRESAGAAGIDVSVEVTTAALPELHLKGQITTTPNSTSLDGEGSLTWMFATRSRRARIAVRCNVC